MSEDDLSEIYADVARLIFRALLEYDPTHNSPNEARSQITDFVYQYLRSTPTWHARRDALMHELSGRLQLGSRCVLYGELGTGKTSLVRALHSEESVVPAGRFFHIDVSGCLAGTTLSRGDEDREVQTEIVRQVLAQARASGLTARHSYEAGLIRLQPAQFQDLLDFLDECGVNPREVDADAWVELKAAKKRFRKRFSRCYEEYTRDVSADRRSLDRLKIVLSQGPSLIALDNGDELSTAARSGMYLAANSLASLSVNTTATLLVCRTEHQSIAIEKLKTVGVASVAAIPEPKDSHWDVWAIIEKRLAELVHNLPSFRHNNSSRRAQQDVDLRKDGGLYHVLQASIPPAHLKAFEGALVATARDISQSVLALWEVDDPTADASSMASSLVRWNNGNIRRISTDLGTLAATWSDTARRAASSDSDRTAYDRHVRNLFYQTLILKPRSGRHTPIEIRRRLRLFKPDVAGYAGDLPFFFVQFRVLAMVVESTSQLRVRDIAKHFKKFGVELQDLVLALNELATRDGIETGVVRLSSADGIYTSQLPEGDFEAARRHRVNALPAGDFVVNELVHLCEYLFWNCLANRELSKDFLSTISRNSAYFLTANPTDAELIAGAAYYLRNYLMGLFFEEHHPYIDPTEREILINHRNRLALFRRFGYDEGVWLVVKMAKSIEIYAERTGTDLEGTYVQTTLTYVQDCGKKLDKVISGH